jgi:hypothetical protein
MEERLIRIDAHRKEPTMPTIRNVVTSALVRDRRAQVSLGALLALAVVLLAPGEAGAWPRGGG